MQQYQRRVHGEFQFNMKSVTMVSIVFTLSFCLNLVAGKNLPYKGSPPAETYEIQGYSGMISMNNAANDRTVIHHGDIWGGTYTFGPDEDHYVKGDINNAVINIPGK